MIKQWIRTRRCGCGNCRYHKESEPGWNKYPDRHKPSYDDNAVWLWRRDYSGEEEQE
ncbi:hypothetical protein GCM10022421_32420 [Oceanisphaera sediminis]|uniref:HNH endonuclease n=1 Tax=Oceanisphaera sediminis TaxID=981381 RepID=A0ABP7EPA7_9GAMM